MKNLKAIAMTMVPLTSHPSNDKMIESDMWREYLWL